MQSLRDQLLKAGVVDEKKVKKAQASQRQQHKIQQKRRQSGEKPLKTDTQATRERVAAERAAQAEKDRQLNAEREAKRARRALFGQVRQMVSTNRQNDPKADVNYRFVAGSQIRQVYVTAAQREQLLAGKLAVVDFANRQWLVPLEIGQKVRALTDEVPVHIAEATSATDEPQAEHAVPDDFTW